MNLNKALELTIQARNDFRATYELEELIKNEMAAEINRGKGTYKPYSTLKKMIQKSIKDNPYDERFHGVWMQDGKQYFCNRISLIELNSIIEGLPQNKKSPQELVSLLNEKDFTEESSIDANQIKLQARQAHAMKACDDMALYRIGASYYSVALLDAAISIIGSNELTVLCRRYPNQACLLKSQNGRALICPVWKKGAQNADS